MSIQAIALGPEGSGVSTLLLQLKNWASSGARCTTFSDPSMLIVAPTTGQEVDTFTLEHRGSLAEAEQRIPADLKNAAQQKFPAPSDATAAATPLAECFADVGFDFVTKSFPSSSASSSSRKKTSTTIPPSSFHPSVDCAVKEIGGRMASLWAKFVQSGISVPQKLTEEQKALQQKQQQGEGGNTAAVRPTFVEMPFNRLLFVVDVTTPQNVPFAAVEFWNCVRLLEKQQQQCRTLVFVNKIRSPASMPVGALLGAMGLSAEGDDEEQQQSKNITVVVGDTWTGEGVSAVVSWLMQV